MRCQRIRYRRVGSHQVDCDKPTGDPKLADDIAVDDRIASRASRRATQS